MPGHYRNGSPTHSLRRRSGWQWDSGAGKWLATALRSRNKAGSISRCSTICSLARRLDVQRRITNSGLSVQDLFLRFQQEIPGISSHSPSRKVEANAAGRRPVRVCFMIDRLSIGGTETQLLALIRHLDRARVEPLLCLLDGNDELSRALEPDNCPVLRL